MNNIRNDEPFYQISQAAKILNITSDRLRTYEEEGLIKPYRTKSKDGKRLFSQNDLDWLTTIRDLIKLGVSIPTIRILLTAKTQKNSSFFKDKDMQIIELVNKLKSHEIYQSIITSK